jgi:hypothetical protein
LSDRNRITLCRLTVAGPGERVTHVLLQHAGSAGAATLQRPQQASIPAPEPPANLPALAPAPQARACVTAAPIERPRTTDTPAPAQARRCPRCLSLILPGDPHCRRCFATVNQHALR